MLATLAFDVTGDVVATDAPFPVALLDGPVLGLRLGAGIALATGQPV